MPELPLPSSLSTTLELNVSFVLDQNKHVTLTSYKCMTEATLPTHVIWDLSTTKEDRMATDFAGLHCSRLADREVTV